MKQLNITISAKAHNSGRSALAGKLARVLRSEGFDVQIDHGPDGAPMRGPLEEDVIIRGLAEKKVLINIMTKQEPREA